MQKLGQLVTILLWVAIANYFFVQFFAVPVEKLIGAGVNKYKFYWACIQLPWCYVGIKCYMYLTNKFWYLTARR